MAHSPHQVVGAKPHDDGVVVLGEAVHPAPNDDRVTPAFLVQALPEGWASLGDLGRVCLDLAKLADVIKQQAVIEVAVVQTIGQRSADLVTTTPQQARDSHYWHVSLRAPVRTSLRRLRQW